MSGTKAARRVGRQAGVAVGNDSRGLASGSSVPSMASYITRDDGRDENYTVLYVPTPSRPGRPPHTSHAMSCKTTPCQRRSANVLRLVRGKTLMLALFVDHALTRCPVPPPQGAHAHQLRAPLDKLRARLNQRQAASGLVRLGALLHHHQVSFVAHDATDLEAGASGPIGESAGVAGRDSTAR